MDFSIVEGARLAPLRPLKTIRAKITAVVVAVTLGVLVVVGGVLLLLFAQNAHDTAAAQASVTSRTIAGTLGAALAFSDGETATELLGALKANPDIVVAKLRDSANVQFAEYQRDPGFDSNAIVFDEPGVVRFVEGLLTVREAVFLDGERVGTLEIVGTTARLSGELQRAMMVLLLAIIVGAAVTVTIALRLVGSVSRPVRDLAAVARAVTQSRNYQLRCAGEGTDELGVLVGDFNAMLGEVQKRDQMLLEGRNVLEDRVNERTHALQQTTDALRHEREQLQATINSAPVPMAMFDAQMRYVAHSDAWLEQHDAAGTSLVSKHYFDTVPWLGAAWRDRCRAVREGKVVIVAEESFERGALPPTVVRWTGHPWRLRDGTIGGIVVAMVSVGDLVVARERAIEMANLRAEFLANMSHELRTPLNGIIGFADLLSDGFHCSGVGTSYVDAIRTSGRVLLELINQVLDFNKIDAMKLQLEALPFRVDELARETVRVLEALAHQKQIELTLELLGASSTTVRGDPARLRQVLLNLIGNALKFTERGTVCLSITVEQTATDTARVQFVVRDTGIGIPAKLQDTIFDAFAQVDGSMTRRFGGTGLGLTIASRLVQLMSGRLKLVSEEGQGSTFSFDIELPTEQQERSEPPVLREVAKLLGLSPLLRVLVAEDNPMNQRLMQAMLTKAGFEVVVAENGARAVEACTRDRFDIVLMDLQMPEMDGFEAFAQIRARPETARLPVVALTAHALVEDQRRVEAAGMDGFLTKPVQREQLFETIRCVTQKRDEAGCL